VGNVRSVCNALEKIGCKDVVLSNDPETIAGADGLILPGVAAFGFAINALGSTAKHVKAFAASGKPLLGICVGYQLLFESSTELGEHTGLGLIEGSVGPLPTDLTVPHMGWNNVRIEPGMNLFTGLKESEHFYFAHSFHAEVTDKETKIAYTDYGIDIVASVQKGSIYGVQFHPEKSASVGLKVLENFEKICKGLI
jgi:glutamine amidotransferase